jgi:predicted DNA repair protein MutK
MPAANLLTLLDDIATIMDDVAILSKVAAKKTSGVLGDDLALNAEQVSGVRAERELPVVWAVAKGSFLNKLILVPSALLISAFAPWAITYLLILGGLFLCFEGVEKLYHKWFDNKELVQQAHQELVDKLTDQDADLVALEKQKIKGAIRTDFVLSAEIIVIILGTVQASTFATQVSVLSFLAIAFTVGVYGFVAMIVKLDDFGLYLLRKSLTGNFNKLQNLVGRAILRFAPILMKTLTIVGTAAMFLVGGGILVHGIEYMHHVLESMLSFIQTSEFSNGFITTVSELVFNALSGIIAGCVVFMIVQLKSLLTK